MHIVPLSLAVLISVGIIVIGCFYVVSPQRILGGFGHNRHARRISLHQRVFRPASRDDAGNYAP